VRPMDNFDLPKREDDSFRPRFVVTVRFYPALEDVERAIKADPSATDCLAMEAVVDGKLAALWNGDDAKDYIMVDVYSALGQLMTEAERLGLWPPRGSCCETGRA